MKYLFRVGAIALFSLFACFAVAQAVDPAVQVRYDPALGHFLTGPNGMTLYVFSNDAPGQSNCYDRCAQNWPPVLVEGEQPLVAPLAIPGEFGVTERSDGGQQLTYNGWPLYYWARDASAGDTTGQAVGDVWWVANLNPVVRVLEHPEHGEILVGPTGMTLYRFTNDSEGMSNCSGGCARNWPPLVGGFNTAAGLSPMAADRLSGEVGVIARSDAGTQVTYNGEPLYYWIRDKSPGAATGHEVGDVWFVVEAQ